MTWTAADDAALQAPAGPSPASDVSDARAGGRALQRQYLDMCRELVRRGLLRERLLSKDAMAELLIASMLDGRLASDEQNPGYDLLTPDGRKVQVKVRCRSSTNRPGKVEFRPDADFDVLAVVELDRDAGAVLRAGLLKAADAHAAVTGVLDKQGRAKVQVQHFFRHAAVADLTAEAQRYDLADVYLGVATPERPTAG